MNVLFLSIVSALVYHSNFKPDSTEMIVATTIVFILTTIVSLSYKVMDFKPLSINPIV